MRISDWSSDVCSSDLPRIRRLALQEQDAKCPMACHFNGKYRICHSGWIRDGRQAAGGSERTGFLLGRPGQPALCQPHPIGGAKRDQVVVEIVADVVPHAWPHNVPGLPVTTLVDGRASCREKVGM